MDRLMGTYTGFVKTVPFQ